MQRLGAQLQFLLTCDDLRKVIRQNFLHDSSQLENSAEHSRFLALTALTLGEYAPPQTDMAHDVKLLTIHHLVKVFAGDAYIESAEAQAAQTAKEVRAAEGLFSLLPSDQAVDFRALWDEFEAKATAKAQFARQLDAFAPTLLTVPSYISSSVSRTPTQGKSVSPPPLQLSSAQPPPLRV